LLTQAQTTNKQKIYNAYLKGDMVSWKNTVDTMLKVKVQSDDYKFELLNYLYGYIGWCLGNEKKPEARTYLDKAELIIKDLEKRKINLSFLSSKIINLRRKVILNRIPGKLTESGRETKGIVERRNENVWIGN
jgi:hypothetical protein